MTRFLIAHPDPSTVKALEATLRQGQHQTLTAHDGLEIIDRALDEKPDAIVLGLNLAGLSGLDVARALRALEPTQDIPILFVAEDAEEGSAVARAGLPHVDCLISPLDLTRFANTAEHMAGARRSLAQMLLSDVDIHLQGITDDVTGLYCREYMLHRLTYEATRSARYKTPLSCLLFAFQDVEAIAEKKGLAERDRALAQIAALLRRSTRAADLVGRAEGTGFLIVAPHTDEKGVARAALRLKVLVRTHEFDLPHPFNHMDTAVGFATVTGSSVADNLALLGRAEAALAQARTGGDHKMVAG